MWRSLLDDAEKEGLRDKNTTARHSQRLRSLQKKVWRATTRAKLWIY